MSARVNVCIVVAILVTALTTYFTHTLFNSFVCAHKSTPIHLRKQKMYEPSVRSINDGTTEMQMPAWLAQAG
jgi:hypothetical protein